MAVSNTDEAEMEKQLSAKKARITKTLFVSGYLSVTQHIITMQSEIMLVKDMVHGDTAVAAKLLANTAGMVGVLGIIANQIGGKLSDLFGRKPFLCLGPLANVFFGLMVFRNHMSKGIVLPIRVLRQILTTFSSTVMLQSAMGDILKGKSLGMATSQLGAFIGLGIVTTPIVETAILQRTSGPKFSYLALSAIGFVHLLWNTFVTPETLESSRRKSADAVLTGSTFNPFGFLSIFKRGSVGLQKMVSITTLQMFLEGKNVADLIELWKRENLKWGVEASRNFVMLYGSLCVIAGAKITPVFLKHLSPRRFTSVTNLTNFLGFMMRGALERAWIFLLAVPLLLPGVNGASGTALKALAMDRATAEGFGSGEFSAWTNNLRALAGSVATVTYGNYYAWAKNNGVPQGSTFAVMALFGTVIPEIILRSTSDNEIKSAVQ